MGKARGGVTPRLLYLDAYDSFANNLIGLLESRLRAEVVHVQIDDPHISTHFDAIIRSFDAVVVGPGPGNPVNPADVGLINRFWSLNHNQLLPVLGICLGFQSLGHAFGARTLRLHRARHGIVTRIIHSGRDMFEGIGRLEATQYHSLHMEIGPRLDERQVDNTKLWKPSISCPDLQPLAWDLDDEFNRPIVMATRHTKKPFWGVQFHPESICTSSEGQKLIETWWKMAKAWNDQHGRQRSKSPASTSIFSCSGDTALLQRRRRSAVQEPWLPGEHPDRKACSQLSWKRCMLQDCSAISLVERLRMAEDEVILLDSQGHQSGRYSILGFIMPDWTAKLTYQVDTHELVQKLPNGTETRQRCQSQADAWHILRAALDARRPQQAPENLPRESPFWGGWMGYISYEAGLDSIEVRLPASSASKNRPDFNFAFVERSIVIDHVKNQLYVQTLLSDDERWLLRMSGVIDKCTIQKEESSLVSKNHRPHCGCCMKCETCDSENILSKQLGSAKIVKPDESHYRTNVTQCQQSLSEGDSYELCYTDETKILLPQTTKPWSLYKRLRRSNPAPHGAYLRLAGTTVLSSSPERFLQWDRKGNCQLRPIKGTVRKTPDMTHEKASAILNTSKERAENLMIVDLIRHDLSGVVGAGNVKVPQLMQVEEYETVFQLVSVIQGRLPKQVLPLAPVTGNTKDTSRTRRRRAGSSPGCGRSPEGIDVLKACIPSGSMTGAPKKRSCEILADLEKRPRDIYAGVLGYMDVGGGGDFSVVIRTAFKHDDDDDVVLRPDTSGQEADKDQDHSTLDQVWRVGAGGAVTIQSTDKGEYEEMETKLESVLKSFQP